MSISQIYEETVKPLPTSERLQLATLILNNIPPQAVIDYSTEWSDEDLQEASAYSLRNAAVSFEEDAADA